MKSTQIDIIGAMNALRDALQQALDGTSLHWKCTESTDASNYCESSPIVSIFTFDEVDANDMPVKTPAVLLQAMQCTSGVWECEAYVTICHPAIQERELVSKASDGHYYYHDGGEFTSVGARQELYRGALMLAQRVYFELQNLSRSEFAISNLTLHAPSAFMSEFPYCSASISFSIGVAQTVGDATEARWKFL